jgi:hypothetical protein
MIPLLAPGARSTRAAVAMYAELEAARSATYRGSDPAELATVLVDGFGTVTEVRLVPTIHRHLTVHIAEAVRLAYEEAERHRMDELREAAARTR